MPSLHLPEVSHVPWFTSDLTFYIQLGHWSKCSTSIKWLMHSRQHSSMPFPNCCKLTAHLMWLETLKKYRVMKFKGFRYKLCFYRQPMLDYQVLNSLPFWKSNSVSQIMILVPKVLSSQWEEKWWIWLCSTIIWPCLCMFLFKLIATLFLCNDHFCALCSYSYIRNFSLLYHSKIMYAKLGLWYKSFRLAKIVK